MSTGEAVGGYVDRALIELAADGCRVEGNICRDAHPANPRKVSPGDVIRCTKGRQAVQFGEPG